MGESSGGANKGGRDMADFDGDVTVLMVNWNTRELLGASLARLRELPDEVAEVIVVDNGSTDGSVEMVRHDFPTVTLIANPDNRGFAAANNQGFARATAPHVLLLNSDAMVEPGAIATCRSLLAADPTIGVVGCRIVGSDGQLQNSVFRKPSLRGVVSQVLGLAQLAPNSAVLNHDRYGNWHPDSTVEVEVVMGSFFMIRRGDFQDGPLFDDGYFMYAEEADLCHRLALRGLRTVFAADAVAHHVKGASTRTPDQRAWSDEAKKRAVLRYLHKWQGPRVAQVANLTMLAGLAPRAACWLLADAADRIRGGTGGRSLKRRVAAFHLAALRDPERFGTRFHGPDQVADAAIASASELLAS